ncbi:MAG TPA: DUF1592 domain-containing protein, partial [Polyangiaceae bacterium]|nr:DUF1592 domain-containing protein [Polyangiaceae bacterium]
TAYEVAARLSHFAALSSPDAELSALAASGEILMRPQLLAQLHRLWQLPAGRAARRLQILQWLGLSTPLRRDDLDAELSADMDAQLASLIDDVLENQDASLTKLLTSRRQLVSNALAEHYGLPVPAEESVDLADLSPTPYAGALSTGPFLSRYRGPSERGLRIREALLCQPLSPHPPGDYPLGAGATPRERITAAVAGKTGCAPCHQLVDPLGFALEAFDDQGSLTGFDTTGAFQSLVTSATTPLSGPLDLGTQIAQSQEGLSCAARRYLEYALDTSLPVTTEARIALSGPSNPADDWTNCLSLVLNTNKGSLAAMSESIVSSVLMLTRADPARYVVAFDTSVDPLEHAYQETLQFRQVFPTSAEELVISAYAEALRQASQGLEAGGDGGAAGAGGASTGTAGHAGAP